MDVPIREAGMYCLAFASARADRAELMKKRIGHGLRE